MNSLTSRSPHGGEAAVRSYGNTSFLLTEFELWFLYIEVYGALSPALL